MARFVNVQNATSSQALSAALDYATAKMPSVRSLSGYALSALGLSQTVLGGSSPNKARIESLSLSASATCTDPVLSCHNSTVQENLCCFNSPGGSLLQTQFWDYSPATGPSDSWTIHGLWPDRCDGTYDANCDDRRAYTNITDILKAAGATDTLSYMQKYWKDYNGNDETFWQHEWGKHGTCVSTLEPDCYTSYQPTEEVPDFFNRTVSLFQSLPSYEWLADAGITPSTSKTYTAAQIQDALSSNHGGHQVYLGCHSGALNEIWYYFNVRGSLQTGEFVPADNDGSRSTCPSTGIKYIPKGSSGSPTSTQTSTAAPTATGAPFTGAGYINALTSGSRKGCIISTGTWYSASGTSCATFHASESDDGFTMTSSKGKCGVVDGKFTCGDGVEATAFTSDGVTLQYDGEGTFSADRVPSGSKQVVVYAGDDRSVEVQLQWQGK